MLIILFPWRICASTSMRQKSSSKFFFLDGNEQLVHALAYTHRVMEHVGSLESTKEA